MLGPRSAIVGWIVGRLTRMRFPVLFAIAALLFATDLVVPDVIPFADEILLGLATAILATWKKRRHETAIARDAAANPPHA
jgi:hypothetical protein